MAGAVGFIGLGNMGGPMATNLAKHGFSLVVHDIDPARIEPLRNQGAQVAPSPRAVRGSGGPPICMVETTAQVEAVIAGEQGIWGRGARFIVVCMAPRPFAVRRLAEPRRAGWPCSTPVSRGPCARPGWLGHHGGAPETSRPAAICSRPWGRRSSLAASARGWP